MTELIVVDLGGVAARYRPERRRDALVEATGFAPAAIDAALFDSGLDAEAERGRYSPEELLAVIIDRLGNTLTAETLTAAWSKGFEPDEAVLDCLDRQGLPLALFTNNGPMIDLALAGPLRGLASHFEHIVCSWHLGAVKPDVDAFERAATRLGRPPSDLLLVEDAVPNVEAARMLGWHAAQVSDAVDLADVLQTLDEAP
jgi:putative hydrolase of the HAD superfamily